jgi:hemolysin III
MASREQLRRSTARAGERHRTGSVWTDTDNAASREPRREPAVPSTSGARQLLYDSRRAVHYVKPLWRGWLHLVWFEASVVLGTVLIAGQHGALRITAAATYAASVSGLFGISALYHRGNWQPRARSVVQRFDHLMIYVLIAGTATPVFLLAAPGAYGVVCLIVMWSLTLAAAVLHLIWMTAPDWLVGGTYIALGAVAALALPQIWTNVGVAAGVLIVAGGVFYIAGAIGYWRRRPDPAPAIFGYHEVFHACVCAAATCHYIAIMLLLQ